MLALAAASSLVALLWIATLIRLGRGFWRRAPLSAQATPPTPAPRVSIVLPARDEEANIERCLSSLLAQRYPDYEVIVVDDRSNDRTLELAERLAAAAPPGRCVVVRGEELPPGWTGKSWANHQGVRRARGEWLLFTDADTDHAPGCLAAAMRFALDERADLVTLLPHVVCETFWERVMQPVAIGSILMGFPPDRVEDPADELGVANGQYLLFRRSAYERVGGHEAIKGRITDDLSLGLLVKANRLHLRVAVGTEVLATRMYTSLRTLWWGYVKNMQEAAALLGYPWFVQASAPLAMWVLPPLSFALGAAGSGAAAGWALGAGAAATLGAVAWGLLGNQRIYKISPAWVLSKPLGALLMAAICLHSHLRARRGQGQVWKGRTYPA